MVAAVVVAVLLEPSNMLRYELAQSRHSMVSNAPSPSQNALRLSLSSGTTAAATVMQRDAEILDLVYAHGSLATSTATPLHSECVFYFT